MGKAKVERFLTHLAVKRNVAASTQNQPLSAIVFLYKDVLGRELEWLDNVERAKRPARVPVVLTEAEVRAVLAQMDGRHALMGGDPLRCQAQAHRVRAPAGQASTDRRPPQPRQGPSPLTL
jgi:site-specific recombinase XerD